MDWKLELVVVPVSDVERAKKFYSEQLGFNVDVDYVASESFRVVQLTPSGSKCSISIGIGVTDAQPGSYKGLHLVVTDIEAARSQLVDHEVGVGEPFHFGSEGQTPGLHPERVDYGTYLSFNDPDGNQWLVQEVPSRAKSST